MRDEQITWFRGKWRRSGFPPPCASCTHGHFLVFRWNPAFQFALSFPFSLLLPLWPFANLNSEAKEGGMGEVRAAKKGKEERYTVWREVFHHSLQPNTSLETYVQGYRGHIRGPPNPSSEGCNWGMQLGGWPTRLFDQVKTDSWHSWSSGRTQGMTYWNYRLIWFLCSQFGTPLHNQIPLHGHGSVLIARHASVCTQVWRSKEGISPFSKSERLGETTCTEQFKTNTIYPVKLHYSYGQNGNINSIKGKQVHLGELRLYIGLLKRATH